MANEPKKRGGMVGTYPDGPNGKVVYVPIGEETAKQGKPINDAIDRQDVDRKETEALLRRQYDESPAGRVEIASSNIANEKAQKIAALNKQREFDAETKKRQEASGYTKSRADIIKGQNQEAVDQRTKDSEEDNSERGKKIKEFLGKSLSQVRDENPVLGAPTPALKKTYTPEETAANRQAMIDRGQGYREKVALNENSQRNKYRQFLADRGEDPDTIGGATLQRENNFANDLSRSLASGNLSKVNRAEVLRMLKEEQSTPSKMSVPMVQDEIDAANLSNQFAGYSNRLSIAANMAKKQRRGDIYASLLNEKDSRRNAQGKSSEARRRYFMDRLTGAYSRRQDLSGNGYAP